MKSELQSASRIFPAIGLTWFSLLVTLICCSGCSTLTNLNNSGAVPTNTRNSAGSYRVEMSGGFGKSDSYIGSLDNADTIQTALVKSGAIKKFRHMKVMVLRVVEESGRPLKMEVDFDAGEKAIKPEQDYALLPGDRIVVQAASHNLIDKMVDSVSGK